MGKTKLAICIEDEEYEARFVKCVMNHYKDSYEIHVFHSINEAMQEQKFHVIIAGDGNDFEELKVKNSILFVLQENGVETAPSEKENIFFVEKYQAVYKIMEELEKQVTQKDSESLGQTGSGKMQMTGVFSVAKESMQIPFTTLLAEILGEKERVLVIDIQPYSGFATDLDWDEETLGMEDLMAVAITGNFTSHRLAASIGHEQKWDFIYPVKNTQCLAETQGEIYLKMIQILQKERGYEKIIINFGGVFPGMLEFMEQCQQIYFLTERKEETSWREAHFFYDIKNQGKAHILQKFCQMEVPVSLVKERSWRQLAKNWLWSALGDRLREINWMENEDGAYM